MTTETMPREFTESAQPEKPLWAYLWPWLLMIPMLAYAAGSQFSFQAGASNTATSGGLNLAAAAEGPAKGQREILILSYSILLILIASRYRRVLNLALQMKAITGLACFAILSTLWSQLPVVSFQRGLYYMVDTLFVYWLFTKLTSAQIRTFIMMIGSVIAICSLFMVLVLPRYGVVGTLAHLGAWQGIFAEKNHAGGVYLFLLTPVVDFSRRMGRKRAIYAAGILLLLFMSQSRTAWVDAVLYPSVMLAMHLLKRVESRLALILSAFIAGATVITAAVVLPNLTEILLLLGRDPTLTGRTVVWGLILQSIAKRPLIGYGYCGFWTGLVGESGRINLILGWGFGYAHNGYLETLLQLGLVGLVFVIYLLLRAVADSFVCFNRSQDPQVAWFTGLILLNILYNFDEETFLFVHHLPTLLLLVALCGLRLARREVSAHAAVNPRNQTSLAMHEPAYSR